MIKIGAETRHKIGIGMIVNIDFALECCLNFKINQFKQTTTDKSVHSVNFSQRNLQHQRTVLKGYIWTQRNGLH